MTNNESKGPFEGLLVIDMTHVLNGPFGTQLLCNMGARVIKVEPPGHGDDTRTFGPYVDGQSLYYSFINHGKESVVLDLKNDHDKSIFINMLVERCRSRHNMRVRAAADFYRITRHHYSPGFNQHISRLSLWQFNGLSHT
jgi:CoA:oxalate CoA-transferase